MIERGSHDDLVTLGGHYAAILAGAGDLAPAADDALRWPGAPAAAAMAAERPH